MTSDATMPTVNYRLVYVTPHEMIFPAGCDGEPHYLVPCADIDSLAAENAEARQLLEESKEATSWPSGCSERVYGAFCQWAGRRNAFLTSSPAAQGRQMTSDANAGDVWANKDSIRVVTGVGSQRVTYRDASVDGLRYGWGGRPSIQQWNEWAATATRIYPPAEPAASVPTKLRCIFCDFTGDSLAALRVHSSECKKHPLMIACNAYRRFLDEATAMLRESPKLDSDPFSADRIIWNEKRVAFLARTSPAAQEHQHAEQ